MPFFVASTAILYYIPYVIFQIFNNDIQSLKELLHNEQVNVKILFSIKENFSFHINISYQGSQRFLISEYLRDQSPW